MSDMAFRAWQPDQITATQTLYLFRIRASLRCLGTATSAGGTNKESLFFRPCRKEINHDRNHQRLALGSEQKK